MRIIAKSTLVAYYTKNPQAKSALQDWYEKIELKTLKTYKIWHRLNQKRLIWPH